GINLFLVMFRNSTITDLFLFVFTQLILHYQNVRIIINILGMIEV
ncbi:capsular biosynthesis protein CpsC, partial [Lactococcus cremoris]|nr:capsular biosynthesis protein CpsC [Lactococcus cremoris]MCT4446020.1 capsular biosynthesis protein CpsC [Lactococcus cremoris]